MLAHCLADFFNLKLWDRGRPPTFADIRAGLEDLLTSTLDALDTAHLPVTELQLRLYGGWYGDDLDTRVPLREVTAAVVTGFPRRTRPRIRINLAETPVWDKSLRMLRTIRSVPLKSPGGRLIPPPNCALATGCTIPSLASWWAGRCPEPSCGVKLNELGTVSRQKMVDTLFTADALSLMFDPDTDIIILASDDDDMLPAMLALGASTKYGIRLRRSASQDSYYDGILDLQGLHTYSW